jgi:hypothetical protein
MHRTPRRTLLCLSLAALAATSPLPAAADMSFSFAQVGADVHMTGIGSFDVSNLGTPVSTQNDDFSITPNDPTIMVVDKDFVLYIAGSITGPASFGSGGRVAGCCVQGSLVGVLLSQGGLFVGNGYQSGQVLQTTLTFSNIKLADMGMTTGVYVWQVYDQSNKPTDKITVTVPALPLPVPEPATAALLALGLLGVARAARRR